tara:strand:+ start:1689 stop:2057 length:369 start_codon:yes stop_codon:yes gene_type:complete
MTITEEVFTISDLINASWFKRNNNNDPEFDYDKERSTMFEELNNATKELNTDLATLAYLKYFAAQVIDISDEAQELHREYIDRLREDINTWNNDYDKTLPTYSFVKIASDALYQAIDIVYNN